MLPLRFSIPPSFHLPTEPFRCLNSALRRVVSCMEVIFDSFLGVSAWLCIHTHEYLGSNFTKKTQAGLKRTSLPRLIFSVLMFFLLAYLSKCKRRFQGCAVANANTGFRRPTVKNIQTSEMNCESGRSWKRRTFFLHKCLRPPAW